MDAIIWTTAGAVGSSMLWGIFWLCARADRSAEKPATSSAETYTQIVRAMQHAGRVSLPGLEAQFPGRPASCLRRRVKPFICGCPCPWCEAVDHAAHV